MTPKVLMISGKIGAGKTTVAKLIAQKLPAFRISHDEMLVRAYGTKLPTQDFRLCCERINAMAWETVGKLVALKLSVVMEGWGSPALRADARKEMEHIGVPHHFIYVSCSRNERRRRVRERNNELKGEGYHISDADFDRMDATDEEFSENEGFILCANEIPDRDPDLGFLNVVPLDR